MTFSVGRDLPEHTSQPNNIAWHWIRSPRDIFRFYHDLAGFEAGNAGSRALRRVLTLAGSHGLRLIGVQPVAVHDDAEWQSELAVLKAKGQDVDDHVIRLDFFGGAVGSPRAPRPQTGKYLGHALVRPGSYRTVLEACVNVPPSTDCYLGAVCEFDEEVPGLAAGPIRARLAAVPFLEQDGIVGSCAHACIRGASRLLNQRFRAPELTFRQISDAAGVEDGSKGLTYPQMAKALKATGYNVLAYQPGLIQLDQIAYHFNESGFPVIVGISTSGEGHALLLVGHQFDSHSWWPEAGPGYYTPLGDEESWISSAHWIGNFVVHDDNFGPYLNVHRLYVRQQGIVALVPVPPEVPLSELNDGVMAEGIAAYILSLDEVIDRLAYSSRVEWKNALMAEDSVVEPVLRTIYLPADDAKRYLETADYPAAVKRFYRNLALPHWVYLIEVSIPSMYGSLLKLGELIIDGTKDLVSDLDGALAAVVAVHLPGFLWQTPFSSATDPLPVDNDVPSKIITRPTFAELLKRA